MPSYLFAKLAARMPSADRTFIETPTGRIITYGDLVEGTGRIARALVARGVRPGDRVAVQVEKSPEAVMLYLACVRAGAVFLPLNTAYTLAELDYFLGDAEPALVVCDPKSRDGLTPVAGRYGARIDTLDVEGKGSLMERAAAEAPDFADVERGPDDLAAILYTSGTTGRSKGAMLSHDNLWSNALTLVDYWRFTSEDVLLHALPIFHTHGLFVATNVILAAGASMIFLPKFDADEVMRLMPKATTMMGVPTFYVRLLQHEGLTREATAHMRLFISGSAPLLADTHRAWRERTGHAILERYGMTETNVIASNPLHGNRKPGTVGLPLPGVDVRIVDDHGTALAVGEVGHIEVRGPNVFKGYWRRDAAGDFTADGFFKTGDLGVIDDDGYLSIVGRGKDLVITGGLNVYPRDVETVIDELPGVVESAVIGVPHPDFGEGVVAVVVRERGSVSSEAEIIAACKARLADYKVPKRIVFADELPRNVMGKVQKNVLREAHARLFVEA